MAIPLNISQRNLAEMAPMEMLCKYEKDHPRSECSDSILDMDATFNGERKKVSVRDIVRHFNRVAQAEKGAGNGQTGLSPRDLKTAPTVPRKPSQMSLEIKNTVVETKEAKVVIPANLNSKDLPSECTDYQETKSRLKMYTINEPVDVEETSTEGSQDELANVEYQSKTTILKSASGECHNCLMTSSEHKNRGVRIIIDLVFEPMSQAPNHVVGSRIETTLPPSKILSDFESRVNKSTSTQVQCYPEKKYGGVSNC